jgi:hypothetical protein
MRKSLKIWLKNNTFDAKANNYKAVLESMGSMDLEAVINEMDNEGMGVQPETALNIITRFNRKVTDLVLSGYSVHTGISYMRPVVTGMFTDRKWNREQNPVYISITQSAELRQEAATAEVKILGKQAQRTAIFTVTDLSTGATDGTLTRGRNAELQGRYLKIAGESPDCGIFLTNSTTRVTTRLDRSDLVYNEPKRLLIWIPDTLEPGQYELRVTTQFTTGTRLLKEPKSALYGRTLVLH